MAKNTPAKKLILIVLAVLLSATVLDLLLWFTSPGEAVVSQPGNTFNLDLTEVSAANCTFDDYGHHVPSNSDPQLIFVFPEDREIQSIAVYLAQPLLEPGYMQVYYGTDAFWELYSVGFSVKAGTKEFYFNIPNNHYTSIRLDLNTDCWLDSVICSNQPACFLRIPPFRPVRIMLIAALFSLIVFIFTRKQVKTFICKLDHDWFNPETRKPIITILYAIFALVLLLHHIVVTIWYPSITKGTDIPLISILFFIFAVISIPLGHMWTDKGFWFLAALILFEYLRLAIPTPVIDTDYTSFLYAFFGCYSVAKALGSGKQEPFLKLFCAIWTVLIVSFCILGLYSAWSGTALYNLSNQAIMVTEGMRLQLFYSYGISGIITSVSLVISIVFFCMLKQEKLFFIFLIVCLVILITSCLTEARTVYVSSAVSLSLIATIWIYNKFNPIGISTYPFHAWKKMLLMLFFIVIAVSLLFALTYLPDGFNRIRSEDNYVLSHAFAEESTKARDLIHRDILQNANINDISTGRIALWKKTINVIFSDFSNLLWGQSIYQPMNIVNSDIQTIYNLKQHTHNLWIQTLLESGFPGLILLLSLHIYFMINAFRLMKNREIPFWKKILPVPVITILISELFEHTVSPSTCYPQLTLLYLFTGFTVAISSQIEKSKAASIPPKLIRQ